MTEVRIRHEMNADGVPLGDVPLLSVDDVIPQLTRWGLRDADGDIDTDRLSGQFILGINRAVFEVMIGADE